MYLFQISSKYVPKNKLCEVVLAHVKTFERICFRERKEVFLFAENLKIEVENFCKRHPRCKAIHLSFSDPKTNEHRINKFDDISVSISELFYGHFLEGKEVRDDNL
jgi:hypothetical protein